MAIYSIINFLAPSGWVFRYKANITPLFCRKRLFLRFENYIPWLIFVRCAVHIISENKSWSLKLPHPSRAHFTSDIRILHHISVENDIFVIKWRRTTKYPNIYFVFKTVPPLSCALNNLHIFLLISGPYPFLVLKMILLIKLWSSTKYPKTNLPF